MRCGTPRIIVMKWRKAWRRCQNFMLMRRTRWHGWHRLRATRYWSRTSWIARRIRSSWSWTLKPSFSRRSERTIITYLCTRHSCSINRRFTSRSCGSILMRWRAILSVCCRLKLQTRSSKTFDRDGSSWRRNRRLCGGKLRNSSWKPVSSPNRRRVYSLLSFFSTDYLWKSVLTAERTDWVGW